MNENQVGKILLDKAFMIHKEIGPGLFESVYESAFYYELMESGLNVERQVILPVFYKGRKLDNGFRIDLLVNNKVIVEIKSIENIQDVHKKQLLTYLKLSKCKLGFIINFGRTLLKEGIVRIINGKITP